MAGKEEEMAGAEETFVYRVSTAAEWEELQRTGATLGGDIDRQTGCIHLSDRHQVKMVLKNFFEGRKDLFLLQLDTAKLGEGLIYESADGSSFPHFYGPARSLSPLPLDAVTKAEKLEPVHGEFTCGLLTNWSNILHKCMLKAKSSPEAGKFFHDVLLNAYEGLEQLSSTTDGETNQASTQKSNPAHALVRPPDMAKTKGSGKRLKGGKKISMEQAKGKDRVCHGCKKRGADHDKRNCPVLRKMIESQGSTNLYEESPIEEFTNLD